MQRKKIEAVPPIAPDKEIRGKKHLFTASADIIKISDTEHLLIDVYRSGKEELLLRMALTEKDYGSYDLRKRKWDSRQLDIRVLDDELFTSNSLYFPKSAKEKISIFTKEKHQCDTPWYKVRNFQYSIYSEKYSKAYDRRQERLENRIRHMPEIPKGYSKWIEISVLSNHYLFYKRKGSYVTVQCSLCGNEYKFRVKNTTYSFEEEQEAWGNVPTHDNFGKCRKCGITAVYKAAGRQNSVIDRENSFIIQRYSDDKDSGIVVRYFKNTKETLKGTEITLAKEKITSIEIARAFFISNRKRVQKDYNKYNPYIGGNFWDDCNLSGMTNINITDGKIYPESFKEIERSEYKYCAIKEYYKTTKEWERLNPVDYLEAFRTLPALEMIVKSGMNLLAKRIILSKGRMNGTDWNEKSIEKILKINRQDLKYLIDRKGDLIVLDILRFEKRLGIQLKNNEREALYMLCPNFHTVERASKYVSVTKLINRTVKYRKYYENQKKYLTERDILQTYTDYLLMLEELEYDMTDSISLYPRELYERHDKLVIERNSKQMELTVKKKMEQYPDIQKIYKTLLKRYRYEDDEYVIRPAKNAGEIVMEGKTLHHCVGGDNYLKKHSKQQSTILFLRKKDRKDMPYITIEINGDKILQWYGNGNHKPEEEKIDKLLKIYTENLNVS